MKRSPPPKISVSMVTYNHEAYIAQAIESVLMQKTCFDYELVIGEDCSTDGNRAVVERYQALHPEVIRAFLRDKNLGMSENGWQTLNACRGQYIAMLDGDDYWTDPQKLQKQITFLEANQSYVFCGHRFKIIDDDGRVSGDGFDKYFGGKARVDVDLTNFMAPFLALPLSVVFRRNAIREHLGRDGLVDSVLWAHLLETNPGTILNDSMGVYRRHSKGCWSSTTAAEQGVMNWKSTIAMARNARGDVGLIANLFDASCEAVVSQHLGQVADALRVRDEICLAQPRIGILCGGVPWPVEKLITLLYAFVFGAGKGSVRYFLRKARMTSGWGARAKVLVLFGAMLPFYMSRRIRHVE
ncbi:MAG: glycosyltransferase [bacterium]